MKTTALFVPCSPLPLFRLGTHFFKASISVCLPAVTAARSGSFATSVFPNGSLETRASAADTPKGVPNAAGG
jgi:hypothetical protein